MRVCVPPTHNEPSARLLGPVWPVTTERYFYNLLHPYILLRVANYDSLFCRRLGQHLDGIDTYLLTCTPLLQKDLYIQLIMGLRKLNSMLCLGPFKTSKFS